MVCFKCQQVHFAEKTNPSWQMIWQSAVFVRHKFWIKDWPVASLQHRALNWQANFLSVISFWKNSQKLLSVQVLNSSLILCQFNLWQKKLSGLGKFSFRMWQFFYRNPLPAWRMFLSAQLLYGVSFELKIGLMPLCKLNCEWEKPAIIAFGSLTLTFQKPNLLGKCYWSAFFVWLE